MFTLKANEIKQIYVFIYTIDLEVKYVRLNSYQTEDKNNERNATDPVKKKIGSGLEINIPLLSTIGTQVTHGSQHVCSYLLNRYSYVSICDGTSKEKYKMNSKLPFSGFHYLST
jgi:hypothetical protein